MAMMLRKAYKKSRSQAQTLANQQVSSSSMTPSVPESPLSEKRVPSKRTRMAENSLFPLEEEDHVNSESAGLLLNSPATRGTSDLLKIDFVPSSKEGSLQRPLESFELEEVKYYVSAVISSVLPHCILSNVVCCCGSFFQIQSFDEGSVSGSCNGPVDPGGTCCSVYCMSS